MPSQTKTRVKRNNNQDLYSFQINGISQKLPKREGVYLVRGAWGDVEPQEIDVYNHPVKGLCCFSEDFGSCGTEVNDSTDCHVSVQCTGLEFIERARDFGPEDI